MLSSAILAVVLCASPAAGADTAVVCPREFREALAPWLAHRRQQGHQIVMLSNLGSPDEVRASIRRVAAGGNLRFLLLVGDADPELYSVAAVRRRSVPAHYSKAVVNVQFGSTREIATDNWYADLDEDRVPDIAVGRLPCDSASELSQLVEKILAYERSADFGAWRRRVHFVAGLGGFGAVADAVLESAAKSLICEGVPSAYSTTMTYGSWRSPYCPDPRDFRRVTLSRLNEGSLFWVYIGHGQPHAVDEVLVPGGRYPILTCDDAARLACRNGAPIACFLACYSGAYDLPRDCLAEEMLRAPGGPVAVLCGSRVTLPYSMSVMGSELLGQAFGEQPRTLGEMFLEGKRRMVADEEPGAYRQALEAAARLMSPTKDQLSAEREEHLDLFNLLGDPLLRVSFPGRLELDANESIAAGETLTVSGTSPLAGRGEIELVVGRGRLTFRPPLRQRFNAETLRDYAETYRQANTPQLCIRRVSLERGAFSTQVTVPREARGPCHVRIFVEGTDGCAAGGIDVVVERESREALKNKRDDAAGE
ncbi:MAG: hypothetical protein DWQ37_21425 [Planctomycetota bacterium]|nr:MAG: hypothetical protein DWQ37_21425 [Planctomycetota bacterium]